MWNDALRIIKEYLPHKVSVLYCVLLLFYCHIQLDEFQREMAARSGKYRYIVL